ncbi:hypothetical protein ACA910_014540 [Epithemia clementina (nom. ined.)]
MRTSSSVLLVVATILGIPAIDAFLGSYPPSYGHHQLGSSVISSRSSPLHQRYDLIILSSSSSRLSGEGKSKTAKENELEMAVSEAFDQLLRDFSPSENSDVTKTAVRAASPLPRTIIDDASSQQQQQLEHQQQQQQQSQTAGASSLSSSSSVQYAALEPGTVVQIQVGDIALARKAWKKRRRSGSPLLVPCSVLNADRASAIRWNLIYLLEKFGVAPSSGSSSSSSSNNKSHEIRISFSSLNQRYRSHLKGSLQKHASWLGFETAQDLILNIFNPRAQETYGVKVVEQKQEQQESGNHNDESSQYWLQAPLSRFRAQKRANQAAILQFREDEASKDTLLHTGLVRNKNQLEPGGGDGSSEGGGKNFYQLRPLSAALRVSQKEDVESGHITNGSLHPAVVFEYDPAGDAGAPLLTLSLNPGRNRVRERLKITAGLSSQQQQRQIVANPKYHLKEMHMGDGPMTGKVVRLIKGGALVDCDVGRVKNSSSSSTTNDQTEMVQVLGLLRFADTTTRTASNSKITSNEDEDDDDDDDVDWDHVLSLDEFNQDEVLVEKTKESIESFDGEADFDGGDDSEDITHLFHLADDGSLVYKDEETGENLVLSYIDEEDDEDIEVTETFFERKPNSLDDMDDDDDGPVIFKKPSRTPSNKSSRSRFQRSNQLRIGDKVEVYVKSVSKQSGQLHLTMSSEIQGRKPKEVKRESDCEKKLARLKKQLGGQFHDIDKLKGTEMNGVVKAMSNTGDWLYVQPTSSSSAIPLPVGVATMTSDQSSLRQELKQGDSVRVRLDGIDNSRGQLAFKVLNKIST